MKTPMFKAWQLALLAGGVAFVGVGLKVVGETTSSTVRSDVNAVTTSVDTAETTIAEAADETAPDDLFGATTNHTVPADLKVSPDLAEIIKLAQGGLSEEVMMAYISNSVRVFNLGSDEIIYLNDLGVPSSVVTAMIQQDTSPESAARKLAGNEPNPLPPGLALNSPATNVYPAQQTPIAQPEDTTDESVTEAPPATTYATTDYAPQPAAVSYFYNSLAPYGNWVNVSGYGLCWQPTVVCANPNWQPYCDRGRWVYSDCGWYWLSDYSWGWAPFHYGRWVSHANYGWVWAPDSTWGPAWVSWRYSQNYCGWAPLPPEACFTVGVGFTYHHRSVGSDWEFGLRAHHYNFIPFDRFCDYSPSRHRVSPVYVQSVFNQTKFVNRIRVKENHKTVINEGIDPAHIATVTRSEVRKVVIRDTAAPFGKPAKYDHLEKQGDKLVVLRPQLPTPTPAKPAASGGRARTANRDRAAASTRNTATGLTASDRTETPDVTTGGSIRPFHANTRRILPSSPPNFTPPATSPEIEKARVSLTRSSRGLTMRGEPRRAQVMPATETAAGASRSEPNRSQNANESPRVTGAQNQPQAQPGLRQTQTFAPVRPTVRSATETARGERQQPRSLRTESRAPQAATAGPHFNPTSPVYSQPNRVEHRNEVRSQPQLARSESSSRQAPQVQSPQPAPQPSAPARDNSPRSNARPSSSNSDKGDRKR